MEIKPETPIQFLGIAIAIGFIFLSLMLFLSPYLDLMMGIGGSFIFLMGAGFLIVTDNIFSTITIEDDKLNLEGYFSIRKIEIAQSEVKGFVLEESVDQFASHHFRINLILKNGKKIVLPKIAYSNYDQLKTQIESRFNLLEIKRFHYTTT